MVVWGAENIGVGRGGGWCCCSGNDGFMGFKLGTTWCAIAKASGGCVVPGIDDVTRPKFKIETPERIRNEKSPQNEIEFEAI